MTLLKNDTSLQLESDLRPTERLDWTYFFDQIYNTEKRFYVSPRIMDAVVPLAEPAPLQLSTSSSRDRERSHWL